MSGANPSKSPNPRQRLPWSSRSRRPSCLLQNRKLAWSSVEGGACGFGSAPRGIGTLLAFYSHQLRRFAFAPRPLVSSLEVPQSMEVPQCGTPVSFSIPDRYTEFLLSLYFMRADSPLVAT